MLDYFTRNIIRAYQGGVVDEILQSQIIEKLNTHPDVTSDWNTFFRQQMQMQEHLAKSKEYGELTTEINSTYFSAKDDCGCANEYATYIFYFNYCNWYGSWFPEYCDWKLYYEEIYINCVPDLPCLLPSWYDGANCAYGWYAPPNSNPFVWGSGNGYYWHAPAGTTDCSGGSVPAWWDGAHCYVGQGTEGAEGAFVYGNDYYTPPRCTP